MSAMAFMFFRLVLLHIFICSMTNCQIFQYDYLFAVGERWQSALDIWNGNTIYCKNAKHFNPWSRFFDVPEVLFSATCLSKVWCKVAKQS